MSPLPLIFLKIITSNLITASNSPCFLATPLACPAESLLELHGLESYRAVAHCARVSALQRAVREEQQQGLVHTEAGAAATGDADALQLAGPDPMPHQASLQPQICTLLFQQEEHGEDGGDGGATSGAGAPSEAGEAQAEVLQQETRGCLPPPAASDQGQELVLQRDVLEHVHAQDPKP